MKKLTDQIIYLTHQVKMLESYRDLAMQEAKFWNREFRKLRDEKEDEHFITIEGNDLKQTIYKREIPKVDSNTNTKI